MECSHVGATAMSVVSQVDAGRRGSVNNTRKPNIMGETAILQGRKPIVFPRLTVGANAPTPRCQNIGQLLMREHIGC
jgi:hypothetical protein